MPDKYMLDPVRILNRTFGALDARLEDHALRVCYLTYRALTALGNMDEDTLRSLCMLALAHDLGLRDSHDVDEMLGGDEPPAERNCRGYLTATQCAPLAQLAPLLLVQQMDLAHLDLIPPDYHETAQILSVADMLDLLRIRGVWNGFDLFNFFEARRDTVFMGGVMDLFFDNGLHLLTTEYRQDAGFKEFLAPQRFALEQDIEYFRLTAGWVDLRARKTVAHSAAAAAAARSLAQYAGMDTGTAAALELAATLHSLGKISLSCRALGETGARQAMHEKRCAAVTAKILESCVDASVAQIAAYRRSYAGVPCDESVSSAQRLFAIADLIGEISGQRGGKTAQAKKMIIETLSRLSECGILDAGFVTIALDHLDVILIRDVHPATDPPVARSETLWQNQEKLLRRIRQFDSGLRADLPLVKGKYACAVHCAPVKQDLVARNGKQASFYPTTARASSID